MQRVLRMGFVVGTLVLAVVACSSGEAGPSEEAPRVTTRSPFVAEADGGANERPPTLEWSQQRPVGPSLVEPRETAFVARNADGGLQLLRVEGRDRVLVPFGPPIEAERLFEVHAVRGGVIAFVSRGDASRGDVLVGNGEGWTTIAEDVPSIAPDVHGHFVDVDGDVFALPDGEHILSARRATWPMSPARVIGDPTGRYLAVQEDGVLLFDREDGYQHRIATTGSYVGIMLPRALTLTEWIDSDLPLTSRWVTYERDAVTPTIPAERCFTAGAEVYSRNGRAIARWTETGFEPMLTLPADLTLPDAFYAIGAGVAVARVLHELVLLSPLGRATGLADEPPVSDRPTQLDHDELLLAWADQRAACAVARVYLAVDSTLVTNPIAAIYDELACATADGRAQHSRLARYQIGEQLVEDRHYWSNGTHVVWAERGRLASVDLRTFAREERELDAPLLGVPRGPVLARTRGY